MADQDDQIEIIDAPADGTAETVVEQVAEQPDEIETLKAQLAEEKRLRADAESKASGYETELTGRQDRLTREIDARFAAEESAAESTLSAAGGTLATAKAAFVKAQEEGRYADAADLAEQIADAKLELRGANFRKQQIEAAKKNASDQAARQVATSNADPEESFLATVSKPSQRWLRAHPDVLSKMVTDQRYFAKVSAADNDAFASGIDRDSEEYFEFVSEKLGLTEGSVTSAPKTRPKPGQTAAAVSGSRRSAGAVPTGRTVHLDDVVRRMSPEMLAAARTSFPNLTEDEARKTYARGVIAQKQRDPSFLPDFKV